jgi:tetratricopeptide (TPR) repeat protein
MRDKRFEEAARELERALEPGVSERDQAAWSPLLGRCYESAGNYQKSLAAYQQAQALRPKDLQRTLDLARLYGLVDLYDQSIDLYRRAAKREPGRKDVVYALARVYYAASRFSEARTEVERYLSWEPRDESARRLLADALESTGDAAGAARQWEDILAVSPDGAGFFRLGCLRTLRGEAELATRAFDRAEKAGFAGPVLEIQRGLLDWRRGDAGAAERRWRQVAAVRPDVPLPRFLAALAAAQSGRLADAAREMGELAALKAGYVSELAAAYLTSSSVETEGAGKAP